MICQSTEVPNWIREPGWEKWLFSCHTSQRVSWSPQADTSDDYAISRIFRPFGGHFHYGQSFHPKYSSSCHLRGGRVLFVWMVWRLSLFSAWFSRLLRGFLKSYITLHHPSQKPNRIRQLQLTEQLNLSSVVSRAELFGIGFGLILYFRVWSELFGSFTTFGLKLYRREVLLNVMFEKICYVLIFTDQLHFITKIHPGVYFDVLWRDSKCKRNFKWFYNFFNFLVIF